MLRDGLSDADRDAIRAQLKAALVRLSLAQERQRRAAQRKAAIRAGNQQLMQKLQSTLASDEVQQALVQEADALLAKSVMDDAQDVEVEATQVSFLNALDCP